jgi:hypothetical protein
MEVGFDYLYPSHGPDGPERWSMKTPKQRSIQHGILTGVQFSQMQAEASTRSEAARRLMKPPHELSDMEAAARSKAAEELLKILPPELQREQPTIIMGRFDEVTTLTEQFNLQAKRLGAKYGIHGDPMAVRDLEFPEHQESDGMLMIALKSIAAGMTGMYSERETFQLTRIGDAGWGIFYRKAPALALAASSQNRQEEIVQLITGCRIDIKRVFIRKASKFFGDYLKQIRSTVSEVDKDLNIGRDVLNALDRIE